MTAFAEWAYVLIALSFIPQTFYSILFERLETKRGAAVIYGLSCLGFAMGVWVLEADITIPFPGLDFIKWGLIVWGAITIIFAFNFGKDITAIFSYRNPAAFEFALLVFVYLLPDFMQNVQWLIIFIVAFLTVFNAIAYALSR